MAGLRFSRAFLVSGLAVLRAGACPRPGPRGWAGVTRWLVAGVVTAVAVSTLTATEAQAAAPRPAAPPRAAAAGDTATAGDAAIGAAGSGTAGVLSRPDLVSAQALARQSKARVEVLGERTESTATFVNPTGSVVVQAYTAPRWVGHTEMVHGEPQTVWTDVDTTLVAGPDGSVAPKAVPSGLVLSGGGGSTVATITRDGRSISTSLPSGTLPRPVLSGNTATYPDVSPGVDLQVRATAAGFETTWVIKSRPTGPLALALPVTTTGLGEPAAAADGSLSYADGAGKPIARIGAPVLVDASQDAVTKTGREGRVATTRSAATRVAGEDANSRREGGDRQVLTYTPDAAFLVDPATVYPVRLDPTATWSTTMDTYVSSANDVVHDTSTNLKVGYNGSSTYRSYLQVPSGLMSTIAGKQVVSATLSLYTTLANSCSTSDSNAAVLSYEDATAATTGTIWSNKPARSPSTAKATTLVNPARGSSCGGAGYASIDITPVASDWASGAYTVPVVEVGASESTTTGYKEFNSNDAGSNPPVFAVTYDTRPDTPTATTPADGGWITSTTLSASATVTDPDGDAVAAQLYAQDTSNANAWVTPSTGSPCTQVASGATSTCTLTGLTNGHAYRWQVTAVDAAGYASTSATAWSAFTVDATAPTAPAVSSTAYPAGSFTPAAPTAGNFTFTTPSADTTSFRYWFNADARSTAAATSSGGNQTATVSLTPPTGPDTLHVQALDAAGNASVETTYAFVAGVAVTTPRDGDRTQAAFTLGGVAPTAGTKVTFAYQATNTGTWTTIPAADVTLNGSAISSWPVATTIGASAATAPAGLVWNAAATLGATDGAYRVQATFADTAGTNTWTTVNTVTVIVDRAAVGDAYATTDLGPGTVSLLTGNYAITSTDVSVPGFNGDMTIRRTFNSFAPSVSGPFGPGWVLSMGVDAAGSAWSGVSDLGSFVKASQADGGSSFFALQADGSYTALGDTVAAGLSLTKTGSGTSTVFTIKDLDGNATAFAYASGTGTPSPSNAWRYRVDTVTQAGTNIKTTATYNADGTPFRFLAPVPAGEDCSNDNSPSTFQPGCRAVKFFYDTGARITAIGMKMALADGSIQATQIACYSYDAGGRLYQAWDPRINATSCGSPVLPVTYTYNTSSGAPNSGKILTVTPPGQAAWTLGYTTGTGTNPYTGKLDTVSRTHNAANGSGTETSTVRYTVPIGTPAAGHEEDNPDLTAATTATWGQADIPVTATVVYAPGDTVSSTSLRDGEVTGIDVNGRAVNTATFSGTGQRGWKINTGEYDSYGHVVRALSAANRDRAVYATSATATALGLSNSITPATLAKALDTTRIYSGDGLDELESFGPYHLVSVPGSSGLIGAREHTTTSYGTRTTPDTDPTTDGPLHQPVQTTTGASQSPDATATNEVDVRATITAYGLLGDATGWTFKTPVRVTTVVAGGTNLVRETVLDPATGQVTQQRQPSAAGATADPGTRVTRYYTVTDTVGDGQCVQPAWYKLPCMVGPGAQPTTSGLAKLPVTTYTAYDYLGRPTTVTETVTDAAGTTRTRTATTSYENSGWSPRLARTYVSGDVGTAVPAIKPTYDATTGLPTGSTTDTTPTPGAGMAGTLTIGYDDFGRPSSYTDADSATTTQTYDSAGRPSVTTWKKTDGSTLATRTLTYNSTTERRGLVTTATDSDFGAITGTYNPDGKLEAQTFPNGLVESFTTDTTGDPVDHSQVRSGITWLHDTQSSNIHGQWTTWNQDNLTARTYTYNGAGRLITAAANRTGGDPCEKRTYTFDVNGNRTSLARQATSGGVCATTSTTSLSYDNADRLLPTGTATGLVYDAWGRITTLPAALAGSTGNGGDITGATGNLTTGYYVTDTVASQTHSGNTDTWTLDPNGRRRVTVLAGTTKTNHYAGDNDNPAWIDEGFADHSTRRYLAGLDGGVVGYFQRADTYTITKYYLADLHGDIKTSSNPAPSGGTPDGSTYDTDEYGNPYTSVRRYTWLGDNQRSNDALASTVLMGARLYLPSVGRFLTTDPVCGGNENAYSYPVDPINGFDLTGLTSKIRNSLGELANDIVSGAVTAAGIGICGAASLGSALWICTGIAAGLGMGLGYLAGQAVKQEKVDWSMFVQKFITGLALGGALGAAYRKLPKALQQRINGMITRTLQKAGSYLERYASAKTVRGLLATAGPVIISYLNTPEKRGR